jgi:hypothetical protein
MGSVNYVDLEEVPDKVGSSLSMTAGNAASLARALKAQPDPTLD